MKKILFITGLISTCIIVVAIIFVLVAIRAGSNLDYESKAYVDKIVPVIVTSWDSKDLLLNASPELIKIIKPNDLNSIFKVCENKLGKFKEYKGSKGQSDQSIALKGRTITASYVSDVIFEKDKATVKTSLIKYNDKWQIMEFRVFSKAILKP